MSGCVQVTKDGKPINSNNESVAVDNELSKVLNSYKGEYAELKSEKTAEIVQEIMNGNISTIKMVLDKPNDFEPPVLFAYSEQVFNAGQKEVGMFWYYTAQLRARSDANKSLDKSVQDAVTKLSQNFGSQIGAYALANLDKLEKVMDKVIEWDKTSERNYNPKWVAILGDDAKFSDKIRFKPEKDYQLINTKVREGWTVGFKNALKQLKEEQRKLMNDYRLFNR